jgi:hypothetical protein
VVPETAACCWWDEGKGVVWGLMHEQVVYMWRDGGLSLLLSTLQCTVWTC